MDKKSIKTVYVWSKVQFDDAMQLNELKDSNIEKLYKTALISINDTSGIYSKSWFNENHSNVLILYFDDVEKDMEKSPTNKHDCKAFTVEQAKKIIHFLNTNKDRTQFIVHCAAGISRSGSVGLFINDYFELDYKIFLENNPFISPNGHISRILNNTYRDNLKNS